MKKKRRILACLIALVLSIPAITLSNDSIQVKASVDESQAIELIAESRSEDFNFKSQKVFTVVAKSDPCVFRASIKDKTNPDEVKYISTESSGNAWYSQANGDIIPQVACGASVGHIYRITFTKNSKNYSVEYYDFTTSSILHTFYANNTDLKSENNIYAYIKAQTGSVQVYEGDPQSVGFSVGETVAVDLNHGVNRNRIVSASDLKEDLPSPDEYDVASLPTQGKAKNKEYSKYFLKDDIQNVYIDIDENNLDYVLQNAESKAAAMADAVTIGDKTVKYASLKTKGNFTRSNVTNPSTSDRFSFTVNFSKYIKKKYGYNKTQNFFGVKKISFNNLCFDKTMMKEYASLRLFTQMGLPTPEYGLAKIYINDQYYGVYFMVESFQSSILERYYGVSDDDLSTFLTKPSYYSPYYNGDLEQYKENGVFTLNGLLKGALTQNTDGSYSSTYKMAGYSGIWENDDETLNDVVNDLPNALNWMEKLTNLSKGKDFSGNDIDVNSNKYLELLNQIMNVEESVKYFATHSFVIQMDNLFTWRQNYGLYIDQNGKSLMLPWDYDLSWGYERTPADGESVANWNIDQLYNDVASAYYYYTTNLEEYYKNYPLFNVIYQNESLRKKMHTYIEDCAKLVALGGTTSAGNTYEAGRFAADISRLYDKVVDAASETLAKNVYYINAKQPDDCKIGMKGLSQIVGLRSVGTYIQVKNINAKVTGYGYPTGCLGNDATTATYTTSGNNIAVVDTDTGIFTISDYQKTNNKGPKLTIKEIGSNDDIYEEIKSKLDESDAEKEIKIYKFTNELAPKGSSKIYLPLSRQFALDGAKIFTYSDDSLIEKEVDKDDNIYSFSSDKYDYVLVLKNAGSGVTVGDEDGQDSTDGDKADSDKDGAGQSASESGKDSAGQSASESGKDSSGQSASESGKDSAGQSASESDKGTTSQKSKKITLAKVKIKSAKKKKNKVVLKWKKVKNAKGYQIQYALNRKFTKKKKTNTTSKKTITIKKLKKKKTYYIRIRAYAKTSSGKKYGKWSKIKKVKIK